MTNNNCKGFHITGTDEQIVSVELVRNQLGNYTTEVPALPGLKSVLIRNFGDESDRLELQMEFQDKEAARRAMPVLEAY